MIIVPGFSSSHFFADFNEVQPNQFTKLSQVNNEERRTSHFVS